MFPDTLYSSSPNVTILYNGSPLTETRKLPLIKYYPGFDFIERSVGV